MPEIVMTSVFAEQGTATEFKCPIIYEEVTISGFLIFPLVYVAKPMCSTEFSDH